MEQLTTRKIAQILNKYQGKITTVQLTKNLDMSESWGDYCTVVYHEVSGRDITVPKLPDNADKIFGSSSLSYWERNHTYPSNFFAKHTLQYFAKIDSLELVNKQGRILKRYAKFIKLTFGVEFDSVIIGILGDKLQNSINNSARTFYVDFTNSIDWKDGQFGHNWSCWWGCYGESRDSFIDGGGWAIRFYNSESGKYSDGIGRTWLMPKYDVLLGFNSYGVSRPDVSKVIKQIFLNEGIELHYHAVSLTNQHNPNIPYINSGTGFVLFVGENLKESYDIDCEVKENLCCDWCDASIDEDGAYYQDDRTLCNNCFHELYSYCDKCGEYYSVDDVYDIDGHSRNSRLCRNCAQDVGAVECEDCGHFVLDYEITNDAEHIYCESCIESNATYCNSCKDWFEYGCECVVNSFPNILSNPDGTFYDINVPGLEIKKAYNNVYRIVHKESGMWIGKVTGLAASVNTVKRLGDLGINWAKNAEYLQALRIGEQVNYIFAHAE